jgi:hypothetical protein
MKKIKKQNTTKVALFAGAAAFMAFNSEIHAQTSVDALLNKLEQKGILTVDEAKELRAENEQDYTNDMAKAFNSIFPMPDWVTGYKLSGDFRGRFDDITTDGPGFADRIRLRYRLRAGLTVDMKDNLEVGFRFGSGDASPGTGFGGNPLSNNSTLQDDGTKKFLYIDTAYGRWTPINDGTWLLAATFGKMDNPFQLTPMVFDTDLTPEGASLQGSYKINDNNSLVFNTAGFVMDELKTSSHDPFMYGAQLVWNAKWGSKVESGLGVAMFDIVNRESLGATSAAANSGVPYINQGNTRMANGALVDNFNPIIADASVTYKFDSFPFYKGVFPIKVAGEFMDNPAASAQNHGIWAGVTFGKSGKQGTWDVSYRYEYLENNAWYDQVVDDDNGAFYKAAPLAGSPGFFGGTNMKGHLIKLNYSITDALTFTFTCYLNDLIHPVPSVSKSDTIHVMADIMWKF